MRGAEAKTLLLHSCIGGGEHAAPLLEDLSGVMHTSEYTKLVDWTRDGRRGGYAVATEDWVRDESRE